jgi:hypothetical protein
MENLILVVPDGAVGAPISHGDRQFRPYLADPADPASRWLLDVPPEVGVHLVKNGGFAVAKSKSALADIPPGMVRLRAPADWACPSFGGITYTPDENLVVVVPAGAAGQLVEALGYRPVSDSDDPAEPVEDPRDAEIARLTAENEALKKPADDKDKAAANGKADADAAKSKPDAAKSDAPASEPKR